MEDYVEAIEDGKIVKVSEAYAKREGLMIIRRQNAVSLQPAQRTLSSPYFKSQQTPFEQQAQATGRFRARQKINLEPMRKPLDYYKNNVVADLIDNFNWEIQRVRKLKNLTRKQVALGINENEETVKMIENGFLPSDNYIVINKVQSYLGINLRKDKAFGLPEIRRQAEKPVPAESDGLMDLELPELPPEDASDNGKSDEKEGLVGSDIEVFDED